MRYSSFFIACGACLCFLWALALSVDAGGACTKHRCDDCPECVPVCTPRYEDKKVKTPRYDVKCSWECVPGREPWHEDSCDPEHNPPCADVRIKKKLYKTEIEEVEKNLKQLTKYTIRWYEQLGKKYGKDRVRLTQIASFDRVDRTQVAAATETLFLDAKNGFAGTSLKKEEPLEKCSMLDDVIVFSADGKMKICKVADKFFVGQRPLRVAIFRKDEDRIYSMIYRDGKDGNVMAKRFTVGGTTRDKEYDLTKGTPGSKVLYFKWHTTNEESSAQMLIVHMKSGLRLRNLTRPIHFAEFGIKARGSQGNIVTKHPVEKILIAPKDFTP